MKVRLLLAASAFVMLLGACGDASVSLLPKSGGRPFEVLIVADNRAAGSVIDSILSQSVPSLPQQEPEFDVSQTDSAGLNSMTRLARSIVIVTVDSARFTKTRIRYDKNVWARQQLVVYVNTPDAVSLRRDMSTLGPRLLSLLVRSEINNTIRSLTASRNLQADSAVSTVTEMRIRIPSEMTSSKHGRGFVWFSNNANSGMSSICVYVYPGLDTGERRFRTMRDSIMRVNIPGERVGMYMTTSAFPLNHSAERVRRRSVTIFRGLWEMHNDAMGGPFVAHAVADTAHNRVVVAEAFVYAPEMKKRNIIRRTEAALYTLD